MRYAWNILCLVRGQGYYTGTIFEIESLDFGSSIAGGGRYDNMIGKFIGESVPAVGFSIGFERIVLLLLERGYKVPGASQKTAFLIEKNMPKERLQEILKEAGELRMSGVPVAMSVMKKNKKFQKEQLMAEGYTDIQEFFRN